MRSRFACLLLAIASFAHAADEPDASPLALSYVLTKDMCLVYLDPTLSYLEPHAVRTFANSMAWQKRTWGWIPYEPVTVLLKDFSDYGNASAGASPRNALTFDISPLSHVFETYPASERMYSLMNHELTHVATMDMYSSQDSSTFLFSGTCRRANSTSKIPIILPHQAFVGICPHGPPCVSWLNTAWTVQ